MYRFFFLILILGNLLLISCNDVEILSDNKQSAENIIDRLKSFNDSVMLSTPTTRVSSGRWLYLLSVASADAGGAYAGGVAGAKIGTIIGHPHVGAAIGAICCGGYTSYQCHRILSDAGATRGNLEGETELKPMEVAAAYAPILKDENTIKKNYTSNIYLEETSGDLKSIGAKHNLLLKNLQLKNFDVESVGNLLSSEEKYVLESDEFEHQMDSVVNQLQFKINEMKPVQVDGMNVPSRIMNLFFDIFSKFPENENDVGLIVSKYLEEINSDGSISDTEKQLIEQSLSVAVSSYEYWKKYYSDESD